HDLLVRECFAQPAKIDIGERIDNEIAVRNADLKQTEFFAITMKTVGFSIERDARMSRDRDDEFCQFFGGRDHFNPLSSNSAFVFVAFMFSMSFSIASMGGRAAIVLRSSCTRSHSSG